MVAPDKFVVITSPKGGYCRPCLALCPAGGKTRSNDLEPELPG